MAETDTQKRAIKQAMSCPDGYKKGGAVKGNWIKGAIKHPGALKAAAKKAGESTHEFAEKHKHDSGKTGNRARLALTLGKMHHKK